MLRPQKRICRRRQDWTTEGTKLAAERWNCIVVSAPQAVSNQPLVDGPKTAYCSDPVSHVLRVRQERYDFSLLYNKLSRLGSHVIAQEITASQCGIVRARLSVTSFQAAHDLKEDDFVLPPNSVDLSQAQIDL